MNSTRKPDQPVPSNEFGAGYGPDKSASDFRSITDGRSGRRLRCNAEHWPFPVIMGELVRFSDAFRPGAWEVTSSSTDDRQLPEDRLADLIERARNGCPDALGELVEASRPYLLLIANQEFDGRLQAKLGASDIVQETLLQARNDIGAFQGNSRNELFSWLRQILLHEVTDAHRHFHNTRKRDARRERTLPTDSVIIQSPQSFTSRRLTPSSEATVREEALALRVAMANMPDDCVEVIKLRNWRQMSWQEVGQEMGKSAEAARKLWSRALQRLKLELDGNDQAETDSSS